MTVPAPCIPPQIQGPKSSFAGWERYPENIRSYDPIVTDGESYCHQLSLLSSTLFNSPGEDIRVNVIDVAEVEGQTVATDVVLKTERELETFLESTSTPRTRILSLAQDYAFSPLHITEDAMRKLLSFHQVPPSFLAVLFNFGDQPHVSDEGSGNITFEKGEGGSFNLCYQYKYVERNNRKQGNPWSIRQTGVYHHHSAASDSNLWIFLHPNATSRLQKRLETAMTSPTTLNTFNQNPLRIHLLVLSSYFDNWRWYLKDLGDAFSKMEDRAMTIDIRESYDISFDTLQNLRHLEEKVIPLGALFRATWGIIDAIAKAWDGLQRGRAGNVDSGGLSNYLDAYTSQCGGHITSEEILQKRIRGILELLSDALNLKNQAVAADINSHLLTLTRDTVDDSATVRVVTLVTLIYLPASFVATIFGMNLFSFNTKKGKIRIAGDFWIYVAFSVPLTLLTVGYWFMLARKSKRRRHAHFRRPSLENEKTSRV